MTTQFESPLGTLYITTGNAGIRSIQFATEREVSTQRDRLHIEAHKQLRSYFEGDIQEFDLPITYKVSPFTHAVLEFASRIPFGKTVTYADLAKQMGDLNKSRAVGHALGLNPVLIVVPCHRVVGTDGKLHGYAGGMERKRALLKHEHKIHSGQLALFKSSTWPE